MDYKTTDLFSVDVDFPGEDIQCLSFHDNSFEWIIMTMSWSMFPMIGLA